MKNKAMKATELRKGNIVYNAYEGGNEKLTAYQIAQIEVMNNGGNVAEYYRSLEYIPLTEEWLLKFGFVYDADSWYYSLDYDKEEETFKVCELFKDESSTGDYSVLNYTALVKAFEYVHQLQNLYFALTQEELTIKE